MVGATHIRVD
jgi:hypothetical protein